MCLAIYAMSAQGDQAITGARPEGVRCSALTRPPGRHNRNGLPHGAAEATEASRPRKIGEG